MGRLPPRTPAPPRGGPRGQVRPGQGRGDRRPLPDARRGPRRGLRALTASGSVNVRLFEVSLTISGPKGAAGPMFVRPTLVVTELAVLLANLDGLIGRDILAECLFLLDGPGAQFLLGF